MSFSTQLLPKDKCFNISLNSFPPSPPAEDICYIASKTFTSLFWYSYFQHCNSFCSRCSPQCATFMWYWCWFLCPGPDDMRVGFAIWLFVFSGAEIYYGIFNINCTGCNKKVSCWLRNSKHLIRSRKTYKEVYISKQLKYNSWSATKRYKAYKKMSKNKQQ